MVSFRHLHRLLNVILVVSLLLTLFPMPLPAQATPTQSSFAATAIATEPAALADPMAISRHQSSYQPGATAVITFTVTNNQLPTLAPDVAANASITDTVDILAGYVITDDMNTLRNVTVEMTVTGGNVVDPNGATQNGDTLTWTLPDIAPQLSRQISVTLSSASGAANFVQLDDGATVNAGLWDLDVSAQARPALVVPDGLDPAFTTGTVDADSGDEDMLWIAAGFQQDPLTAFEYVRGFTYDPYRGSLRGTRGTLWGESGNSLDQSSLLIALLRSAGVPARYRQGTLDQAAAGTLINGMFPPAPGLAGHVPAGAAVADPAGDPELIDLVRDHWWVEAYLPGSGWTDLDPSFPNAQPGDVFATPGPDDRIAEIPAALRHTIAVELEVEKYQVFPVSGSNLTRITPLTVEFPTAQLASKPLYLAHIVNTNAAGFGGFATVTHTYQPYVTVGAENSFIRGESYEDLLTSFGPATNFAVAQWLHFTVRDIDGNSQTHTRVIKDLLGPAVRSGGGTPVIELSADSAPFVSLADINSAWILPNEIRNTRLFDRYRTSLTELIRPLVLGVPAITSTDLETATPQELAARTDALLAYQAAKAGLGSATGLEFAGEADLKNRALEETLRVKLYLDAPRLILHSDVAAATGLDFARALDLRATDTRTIVYPGQAVEAEKTANWLRGVLEGFEEDGAIWRITNRLNTSTVRIFTEAYQQGIEPILITPSNAGYLELYGLDPELYGYAAEALAEGKQLLLPSAPVDIDGEPRLAWFEIDPDSGETVSVLDNGLHGAAGDYGLTATFVGMFLGWYLLAVDGATLYVTVRDLYAYVVCNVVAAIDYATGANNASECSPDDFDKPDAPNPFPPAPFSCHFRSCPFFDIRGEQENPTLWTDLPAHLCPTGNCGIGRFALSRIQEKPIPLPNMGFGYRDLWSPAIKAQRTLTVADNGGGGAPALILSLTDNGPVEPTLPLTVTVTADANFDGDVVVAGYVPDGWRAYFDTVDTIRVEAAPGTPAGAYTILVVARPEDHPDLLTTVQHTVTITNSETLLLTVEEEPNITVPLDLPGGDPGSIETNDGEAEYPNSAYKIEIGNRTAGAKTFDVSVSGIPAGWAILNGARQSQATVDLEGGTRAFAGLYIAPPAAELPPPGSSYNVTVTATDGGSLSETENFTWTMPGQGHNFVEVTPDTIYVGANDTVTFTVRMENVGNAAAVFPINVTTPVSSWSISPLADIALDAGQSDTQTVTLTTVDGEIGRTYPLQVASPAPGTYTQYAFAEVAIISPNAGRLGNGANDVAACAADPTLAAGFDALFNTFSVLETACSGGACNSQQRDAVVGAVNLVVDEVNSSFGGLDTAPVSSATDILANANTVPDILDALPSVSSSVGDLVAPLCAIAGSQPDLRWTPAYSATLSGEIETYSLELTNQGTVTSSYALTVTLPGGPFTDAPVVGPGQTASYDFPLSSVTPALLQAQAQVVADATPLSSDGAAATLNVVDRFIQLTTVTVDPDFVETGASQSDIRIGVANLANVPIAATAELEVVAAGGGVVDAAAVPLLVRPGNARTYDVSTLDTSGYAAGVYTVTVNLVDGKGDPIDDGFGYATLGAGEALAAVHYVVPDVVAPGTVTVTTVISTGILLETVEPTGPAAPLWKPTGLRNAEPVPDMVEESPAVEPAPDSGVVIGVSDAVNESLLTSGEPAAFAPTAQTGIARLEEFEPGIRYDGLPFTTTGSWSYQSPGQASGGQVAYNGNDIGATVSYDFSGDWVAFGVMGDRRGGTIDVAVDGIVIDTVDTYRRVDEPISRVYDGLGAGAHTIALTVITDTNPLSGQNRLYFDYFETWDGTAEPAGAVAADLVDLDRIRYSNGWSVIADGAATGGDYVRSNSGNLWFHFTGDSVTYEAFAYSSGDVADVWIDGVYQTRVDLYSTIKMTRTVTFDGLGAGPHVMLVRAPRGFATADRFHAPAIEPATALDCGAYCRYEEADPALRFNGHPLNVAPDTFFFESNVAASDGWAIETRSAGDAISLTFDGAAVAIGFLGTERGGLVDVYVDGALAETVDTYRTDDAIFTRFYALPSSGTHTISATLTADQHPNALASRMYVDFIDVWDGNALPSGTQEAEDVMFVSDLWGVESDPITSGGSYWRSPGPVSNNHRPANIWIPFEGDSIQFDAVAFDAGDPWTRVYVDGVEQPAMNLWNDAPELRTFAFDGFGPGLHLLQIQVRRDRLAIDTVTTPATQAAHENVAPAGLIRYEEEELTYDGYSWEQRPAAWQRRLDPNNIFLADGYSSYEAARTSEAGRTAGLTFTGSWANVGLYQSGSGGTAEIYVDGILEQTVNLNGANTVTETQLALTAGTHTISVTAVGDGQVVVDYVDVYDGTPVSEGEVDAWLGDVGTNTRVHFSHVTGGVRDPNATNGRYSSGGRNAWFTFLGDSVTFYAFPINQSRFVDVHIDGQFVETVSMAYDFTPTPLAFRYDGLGDGPHTIRIQRNNAPRIDGFAAPAPNVPFLPTVEWNGAEPAGNALNCGICSGITAGDINGDGIVELIFGSETSFGQRLFVYRGDGADTGDGDAVIWSDAYGSGDIGTPALGELDPAYPGTEIVVLSNASLRVYHADGTLWWENTAIQMYDYIGAPALGNLDADPEPEIVVNAKEELIVLDADGTELWSVAKSTRTAAPLLADLTGDGMLDIVVGEYGKTSFPTEPAYVYLYDYNFGSPTLVWTQTLTTTMVGLFGAHAVADIDGEQPGGDDGPEIAVSHNGYMTILDADGALLWSTPLDSGEPGGVSIADLDGDGEVEIVTGMKHEFEPGRFGKLYALNADGSILWDVIAEDSTSANSAAVLDLNGDGIYEVAWNGLQQGFNIFSGLDGSVLFNDPTIFTRSGTDYPIIVDADGDDSAEIVIATQTDGVVVLGFDGVWGEARSIWNQATYHITNVNDDLTIPTSELNSWELHNTYKTQYPDETALPIFGVNISHTVGSENVSVADFNVPPDLAADPLYQWNYVQSAAGRVVTRTLDLVLAGMAPGETRLVAEGTVVSYTLGSGQNQLVLPPLYVTAARLIEMESVTRTVGAGSTAVFTVTLTNPTGAPETYDLGVAGLEGLVDVPASVDVPAGAAVDIPLTITTTPEMAGVFDFVTAVDGGVDSAVGQLTVVDALDLSFTGGTQTATPGETRVYTVTVSNELPTVEVITLTVDGLPDVNAPATVSVAGGGSVDIPVTVRGYTAGRLPFTISGSNASGAADSAAAILDVSANQGVSVMLDPVPTAGGPATPTVITATVTNTGGTVGSFDLAVTAPAGWESTLATDVVTLTAEVFNATAVPVVLVPPAGTPPGAYDYTVTATGRSDEPLSNQPASFTATGTVQVGTAGVDLTIDPADRTLLPSDPATWTITVTNTGSVANTYVLTTTGIAALGANLSQDTITLNGGESTSVQLSATDFSRALATTYTFAVAAIDQDDAAIGKEAAATVTFLEEEAVLVSWEPISQTVAEDETAYYLLTVTNTGSVQTVYDLSVVPQAGAVAVTVDRNQVTLPAQTTAEILVSATAGPGTYQLLATAQSAIGTTESAVTTLIVPGQVSYDLFMPIIFRSGSARPAAP